MATGDENKPRNRKANFTVAETTLILEEAEKHIDVIRNKFSSVLCNKQKNQVWADITRKVNCLGVCERGVQEIKDKWRAMVSSARKEHCNIKKSKKMTGGGRGPSSPNASTKKLLDLFSETPSFSGIVGGLETAVGTHNSSQQVLIIGDAETLTSHVDAASGLTTIDLSDLTDLQDPAVPPTPVRAAEPEAKPSAVIANCCKESNPKKRIKATVTMDDINAAHLEVIKLEKVKLEKEIENILLQKEKVLLEIEEVKLRKSKLIGHES